MICWQFSPFYTILYRIRNITNACKSCKNQILTFYNRYANISCKLGCVCVCVKRSVWLQNAYRSIISNVSISINYWSISGNRKWLFTLFPWEQDNLRSVSVRKTHFHTYMILFLFFVTIVSESSTLLYFRILKKKHHKNLIILFHFWYAILCYAFLRV